jgi:hypothetical protein
MTKKILVIEHNAPKTNPSFTTSHHSRQHCTSELINNIYPDYLSPLFWFCTFEARNKAILNLQDSIPAGQMLTSLSKEYFFL